MAMDQPLLGGTTTTGMFGPVGLVVQVAITAAFWNAKLDLSSATDTDKSSVYNFYVGVALMMFVGFGYLMTFLKSYGIGAVGLTMFITCLGVEFAVLIESYMGKGSLEIDFLSLLNGKFAVAAVLISFGGLIGKISPMQITVSHLSSCFATAPTKSSSSNNMIHRLSLVTVAEPSLSTSLELTLGSVHAKFLVHLRTIS